MAVRGNLDGCVTFWPLLISNCNPEGYASTSVVRGGFFTTDDQYQEFTVIPGKTWLYTRIVVDVEGAHTAVTSKIDYGTEESHAFKEDSGTYGDAQNGSIVLIFNDNYGGAYTHVVLGEAINRHTG